MSAATRTPPQARSRRSQAERTAETRTRIIDAVVESISEVGFQNTTAAEIVRRAGLTWGAVQHQFGGKDGILMAVLGASFDHFAECLGDIEAEKTPLDERVNLFIERAWEHFGSPGGSDASELRHKNRGGSCGTDLPARSKKNPPFRGPKPPRFDPRGGGFAR